MGFDRDTERSTAAERVFDFLVCVIVLCSGTAVAASAPLFGPDSGVAPPLMGHLDPYCPASGAADSSAWIERIDFNTALRPTGANGGYFVGSYRDDLSFVAGDVVKVRAEPGHSGEAQSHHWTIWVDANVDGMWDASELVLTMQGDASVDGEFLVPEVNTLSRLRVVMTEESSAEPCGQFANGEVEDYWIVSPRDRYCSSRGDTSRLWIESIQVDEYDVGGGTEEGYSRALQKDIYHLPPEVTYTLTPGYDGQTKPLNWLLAIDTDDDGVFGDDEELVSLGQVVGEQSGVFAIPPIPTFSRMRVVVTADSDISACGEEGEGETKDLWVTTAPVITGETWGWSPACDHISASWHPPVSRWGTEIVTERFYRDGVFIDEGQFSREHVTKNWSAGLLPGARHVVEATVVDADGYESPRSRPVALTVPSCKGGLADGDVRILVALVSFAEAEAPIFSREDIADRWFGSGVSAHAYFKEVSYGATNVTGEVTEWLQLGRTAQDYCTTFNAKGIALATDCERRQITAEAAELAAPALNPDDFDAFAIVVNGMTEAIAGTKNMHFGATEVYSSSGAFIHELGHVLGLAHAGDWRCEGPFVGQDLSDLRAGGCDAYRYGDVYDPMGDSIRHFNALSKLRLGYIGWEHFAEVAAPIYVQDLPLVQELDLDPIEVAEGQTYAARVSLEHGSKAFYAVEYRTPTGFDAIEWNDCCGKWVIGPPILGLQVRLQREEFLYIDNHYIPITVDETTSFDDPYRRIRIEALELGERARVRVTYYVGETGEPCQWNEGCQSGHCVDGYCCESSCEGQCEACDTAALEGSCEAVEGAPRGERSSCSTEEPASGGWCNGIVRDQCEYPTVKEREEPKPKGGCGCTTEAHSNHETTATPAWLALATLSFVFARRRRHGDVHRQPTDAASHTSSDLEDTV